MFQMGGIGPMFGQVGFFHKFAGKDFEDKRPRDRYVTEARRLLGVLNERLTGRTWLMGETTPSPTWPPSPGCATSWASMERGSWCASASSRAWRQRLNVSWRVRQWLRALLIPKRD